MTSVVHVAASLTSDSAKSILVVSDYLNIMVAAQRDTFVSSNNGLLTALSEGGISIAGLCLFCLSYAHRLSTISRPTKTHDSSISTWLGQTGHQIPHSSNVYAKFSKTTGALGEVNLMYISQQP